MDELLSSAKGAMAIFSSIVEADAALRRAYSPDGFGRQPSILTRRSVIRTFIGRKTARLIRQKPPKNPGKFPGGRLNGILGLTAGVGAIESAELGAVIATGSFHKLGGQQGRGLLNKLSNLGLSEVEIDHIVDTLGDGGVLVAYLDEGAINAKT